MEEVPENGMELSHSAHGNEMNVLFSTYYTFFLVW